LENAIRPFYVYCLFHHYQRQTHGARSGFVAAVFLAVTDAFGTDAFSTDAFGTDVFSTDAKTWGSVRRETSQVNLPECLKMVGARFHQNHCFKI
jgi:hypothetical protein